MIGSRTLGSIEGHADNQFSQPTGICISSAKQEVFVVDGNNHRVQVFDLRSLAYIRTIGGHRVVLGRSGALNHQQQVSELTLGGPISCALDDDGYLYVSDMVNHCITVFDQITGEVQRIISRQGSLAGFVNNPHGIAIDNAERHLYVCDHHNHRVQVFDKDSGAYIRTLGKFDTVPGSAPGQFNEPVSVALDKENNTVLVCDFLNDRIQVYDKMTGDYIRSIEEDFRGPKGVHIDSGSNLLCVTDGESHQVKIFDKNTYHLIRAFKTDGNENSFNRPVDLCVSAELGSLLVVDSDNHRVNVLIIEELQNEKYRIEEYLRALGASAERQRKKPKASRIAVETDASQAILFKNEDTLDLHFTDLGPLHSIRVSLAELCGNDEEIERKVFPQLQKRVADKAMSTPELKVEEDLVNSIMTLQAEAFMSAMTTACAHSPSPSEKNGKSPGKENFIDTKKLLVPSALALHSLLERDWKPQTCGISREVVASLATVLLDLDTAAVTADEKERTISAISAIFREAARSGDEKYVYRTVLDSLQSLHEPCHEILISKDETNPPGVLHLSPVSSAPDLAESPITIIPSPDRSNIQSSSQGMLYLGRATIAHLQLLCDILDQVNEGCSSNIGAELGDDDSTANQHTHVKTNKNLKPPVYTSAYHKDVIRLIFGKTLARCSNPTGWTEYGKDAVASSTATSTAPGTPNSTKFSSPNGSPSRHMYSTQRIAGSPGDHWRAGSGMSPGTQYPPFPVPGTPNNRQVKQIPIPNARIPTGLQPLLEAVFHVRCANNGNVVDKEDRLELRRRTLTLAADHFREMQNQLKSDENETTKTRRTRGGSNIWRKEEQMRVGDLVDAMDKEKCWFESIITEVRPGMNVKVHFMGWGSKWDDIIPIDELEDRILPLNVMTRDWRGDLFEGGLIEIKCNDDTFNQKWMWGKIVAMSVEEEWVDVSYNFSNEPVIIKRAKLYGETICPLGMHTKDRSKAVLATIVRPPRKAEELVSRKEESINDVAFHDREDELLWGLEQLPNGSSLHGNGATVLDATSPSPRNISAGASLGSATHRSSIKKKEKDLAVDADSLSTLLNSDSSPIDHISRQVFQLVMSEVMDAVTEGLSPALDDLNSGEEASMKEIQPKIKELASNPTFIEAQQVLCVLASGPFRRLLAPYFCRILTYRCGMHAKLHTYAFLARPSVQFRTADELLSSAATLRHIQRLEDLYGQLAVQCLGGYLSVGLMRRVLQRLSATVKRCAITTVASAFTVKLCNSHISDLQRIFLEELLQGQERYSGKPCALRGLLSKLLDACDPADLCSIAEVWTNVLADWVKAHCLRATSNFPSKEMDNQILGDLLAMLDTARQACEQEFRDSAGTFRMCAEVAFHRAFSNLPPFPLRSICRTLAYQISWLLDTATEMVCGLSSRAELLDRTLDLVHVSLAESAVEPFRECYETMLASRLLSNNFSIDTELEALRKLPCMPQAAWMLNDLCNTGFNMMDFKKGILSRLDRGELSYGPEMELLFRKPDSVRIRAISAAVWPAQSTQISSYYSLRLPDQLAKIALEYERFCSNLPTSWPLSAVLAFTDSNTDSKSGTCNYKLDTRSFLSGWSENHCRKKKLFWCHGSGAVSIDLIIRGRTRLSLDVTEPLAAVLLRFNVPLAGSDGAGAALSVREVSDAVNLRPEVTSELLEYLCLGKDPVLEEISDGAEKKFRVCTQLLTSMPKSRSERYTRLADPRCNVNALETQERKWLENFADCAILRCLKKSANGAQFSAEDICAEVRESISGKGIGNHVPVRTADILARCELLVKNKLIRKFSPIHAGALCEVGYALTDSSPSPAHGHSLFHQIMKTLGIVTARPENARVSMKQFTYSFHAWISSILLPLPQDSRSGPEGNSLQMYTPDSPRSDEDFFSRLGEESIQSTPEKEARWSDPLRNREVQGIVSSLLLSTGVAITQLARLEAKVRPLTIAARLSLEEQLFACVSSARKLANSSSAPLQVLLDKIDVFRLCFENIRPSYIKAALQLLYSCSKEPCPSPESLDGLDTSALVERVAAQWKRKHAVSPSDLERACTRWGSSNLVDALLYIGATESGTGPVGPGAASASAGIAVATAADDDADKGDDNNMEGSNSETTSDREGEEKGVSPNEGIDIRNGDTAVNNSLSLSLKDIFYAVMQYDEPASRAAIAAERAKRVSQISRRTNHSITSVRSSNASFGVLGHAHAPPSILARARAMNNLTDTLPHIDDPVHPTGNAVRPPQPPTARVQNTGPLVPPSDLPSMSTSLHSMSDMSSSEELPPDGLSAFTQVSDNDLSLADRLLVFLRHCEQKFAEAFPDALYLEEDQETKKDESREGNILSLSPDLTHVTIALPQLCQLLVDNTAAVLSTRSKLGSTVSLLGRAFGINEEQKQSSSATSSASKASLVLNPSVTSITEEIFNFLDTSKNGSFGPEDMQSNSTDAQESEDVNFRIDKVLLRVLESEFQSSDAAHIQDAIRAVQEVVPTFLATHDIVTLLVEANWELTIAVDAFWANPSRFSLGGIERYKIHKKASTRASTSLLTLDTKTENHIAGATATSHPSSEIVRELAPTCSNCDKATEVMLSISCGHGQCDSCWQQSLSISSSSLRCSSCTLRASPHFVYSLSKSVLAGSGDALNRSSEIDKLLHNSCAEALQSYTAGGSNTSAATRSTNETRFENALSQSPVQRLPCVAGEGESFVDLRTHADLSTVVSRGLAVLEACQHFKATALSPSQTSESPTPVGLLTRYLRVKGDQSKNAWFPMLLIPFARRLERLQRALEVPRTAQPTPLHENMEISALAQSIRLHTRSIGELCSVLEANSTTSNPSISNQISGKSSSKVKDMPESTRAKSALLGLGVAEFGVAPLSVYEMPAQTSYWAESPQREDTGA